VKSGGGPSFAPAAVETSSSVETTADKMAGREATAGRPPHSGTLRADRAEQCAPAALCRRMRGRAGILRVGDRARGIGNLKFQDLKFGG